MKHIHTFESFLNENLKESYSELDVYKAVVDILKTLHGFSSKIKFRVEDVNGYFNIVYDDAQEMTKDCLKDLQNRKFWNTGFAPTIGKFASGRINITFEKSTQEILNIQNFDKKDWKPNQL
jgi:hypothetical protein